MEEIEDKNKIEDEKKELVNWKKKLKYYLSINTYKQEEFFLISKYWLEKYKNNFLNFKLVRRNSLAFLDEIKDNNNELFTPFTEKEIELSSLPRIFVINKTIWLNIKNENKELSAITAIGYFSNKLLTLQVLNLIYCFIFLDCKKQIRQGYLEIFKKEEEEKIIKEFKEKGFFEFIKKNKKEYSDNIINFKTEKYKMYVFQSFYKKEENMEIFEKDDENEAKIIKRNRAKTIRQSISGKNKNMDELNYCFGEKVFRIKKSNKIEEKEKMGKITIFFKQFINFFKKEEDQKMKKNESKNENKKEEKKREKNKK